ncbi:MAG: putative Splicing factor 3B subunit 4 [Streblomastix strix]|uniref:Putative Splicing factor 3B subunit 4 n=1 Tax=Streblomastix strix TaxID=222440 RepID=A0A5J4VWF7_9EUKA|nr:MAG: putative Splicing factor 3B subunit 4 [Streblomastix strix]
MSGPTRERNQDATVCVRDLDARVTDRLLFELFTQVGPVVNVFMPKDKLSGTHKGNAFIEFKSEDDAEYALRVMNMVKLYDRPIKVDKTTDSRKQKDVGANLFVSNLDPSVDEGTLYSTFSSFGTLINDPKVMRDTETRVSKGYGFISYDCFEASDLAQSSMNGQYLNNKQITVSYAFKKDSKNERHGDTAERLLAAQNSRKPGQPGEFYNFNQSIPAAPINITTPTVQPLIQGSLLPQPNIPNIPNMMQGGLLQQPPPPIPYGGTFPGQPLFFNSFYQPQPIYNQQPNFNAQQQGFNIQPQGFNQQPQSFGQPVFNQLQSFSQSPGFNQPQEFNQPPGFGQQK